MNRELLQRARSEPGSGVDTETAPRIVTALDFAQVEEPGADPLVGGPGQAVIPENGDVMLYGDGGASKTTLGNDLGAHLAAGDDWLGIPVPKAVRVLLIEAEGPRPLFRLKLRGKLEAWRGSEIGDRLLVLETPWADFRFPDGDEIASLIGEQEVDVLIVGPLTRVGMEELGTLQQVRDFMAEVDGFRAKTGRRLTVVLIHHENKGGKVSGAWEGAGDTLLHAEVRARGKTRLTFQKARWASEWHKQALELDWIDGENFEVAEEPDRDLIAEISEWLRANPHSTVPEIATKKKIRQADGTKTIPGIQARESEVAETLEGRQDCFRLRTKEDAKAVGRHPSAQVWEVRERPPAGPADLGGPPPPGEVQEQAQRSARPVGGGPLAGGPPRDPTDTPERRADLGAALLQRQFETHDPTDVPE